MGFLNALVFLLLTTLVIGGCAAPATPTPAPPTPTAAAPKAAPVATPAAVAPKPTAAPVAPTAAPKATPVAAKPAQLIPLPLAHTAIAASQTMIWALREGGIFQKNGLALDLKYVAGSAGIQAMMAGDVKMLFAAGSMTVLARLAGADAVVVAAHDNTMNYLLVTRPDIKTPADLKGKRLAITRYGDSSDYSARYALKRMGLKPEEDVAILQIGPQPERFASIEGGSADGTVVDPPFTLLARRKGYTVLHDLRDAPYLMGALITTRDFISKNEDTVRRAVTAWVEGIHFYKTNQDAGRKAVSDMLKLDDKELIEEGYSFFAKKFVEKPYPTSEAVQAILDEIADQNPKAKEFKPSDLLETRFVKELDDSGFIKKLYQ